MPLRNPAAQQPAFVTTPLGASLTAGVWLAANRACFMRLSLTAPGSFRYLNWTSSVASGNIQVGVVTLAGAGHTTFTPVISSGVIACPAAGDIRTDLGVFTLPAGDYALFFWADNVTVQIVRATSVTASLRVTGQCSSLASGVIATGTLTWGTACAGMSLEADV